MAFSKRYILFALLTSMIISAVIAGVMFAVNENVVDKKLIIFTDNVLSGYALLDKDSFVDITSIADNFEASGYVVEWYHYDIDIIPSYSDDVDDLLYDARKSCHKLVVLMFAHGNVDSNNLYHIFFRYSAYSAAHIMDELRRNKELLVIINSCYSGDFMSSDVWHNSKTVVMSSVGDGLDYVYANASADGVEISTHYLEALSHVLPSCTTAEELHSAVLWYLAEMDYLNTTNMPHLFDYDTTSLWWF